MGAQKKKAIKFRAKGHLSQKLKKRNEKRKLQAMKEKRKKNRQEQGELHDAVNAKKHAKKQGESEHGVNAKGKKEDSDMMDDMDVDEFLNGEFLDSDAESLVGDDDNGDANGQPEDDDMGDDGSSSEEEDESALDPRYMSGLPDEMGAIAASDDEDEADDADDDDDNDNDDAEEGNVHLEDADKDEQPVGRQVLTMEALAAVETSAFEKNTAGGLRKIVKIFSDACRSSDAADSNRATEITYEIESSAVYNRLMLNMFRKAHVAFAKLVASSSSTEVDEDTSVKLKIDERKWNKHALLFRRFFSCVCYLLEQTTSHEIQLFVLRELEHYTELLVPCAKTARRLLKSLLKVWAKTLQNNVCMLAFVRIRDLAVKMPFPFLELCLKGIYLTYMRNTKFTNETTLPHHILMGNCVVELFGIDLASSYQHAFIYIRQLAITVRKTIIAPSADSFKAVLNWQFFNQLRVWTAVVCAHPQENQLRPLVYPLCQLLFATVRLASTIRYAPLRFHCVKLLQQLAFATHAFVPTSPVLLEILKMPPFSTSYKGQKSKPGPESTRLDVDLELCVKLSKAALDNKRVHDLVMTRLFELLQRECDVYKFSIGFPEFAVPLILTLNKFASTCKIPRWKALARGLVDSLKKRSDWIRSRRSGLDVCPKDVTQLDEFLKQEREAAVERVFANEMEDLKKRMDSQQDSTEPAKQNEKDSEDEAEVEADDAETEGRKQKKRRSRKKKQGKQQNGVDDETFAKVKKMSLNEFKKSVAAVDQEDKVEDFTFSDEE